MNVGSIDRNPLDLNYAHADGSVRRINGVKPRDDRMARFSTLNNSGGVFENATGLHWQQVPFSQ